MLIAVAGGPRCRTRPRHRAPEGSATDSFSVTVELAAVGVCLGTTVSAWRQETAIKLLTDRDFA